MSTSSTVGAAVHCTDDLTRLQSPIVRPCSAALPSTSLQCQAEGDWAAAVAPLLQRLEQWQGKLDRERTAVFLYPLAKEAAQLPEGKAVVAPIAYEMGS